MMVTTTVPDKLSVMSFVYLMYQYFTKDTMSAIAKAEREEAAQGNTAGTTVVQIRTGFVLIQCPMYTLC